MTHPRTPIAFALLALLTACAQPAFQQAADGREPLPDGNYVLTLSSGTGHSVCAQYFPEGRQQAFSVEGGVVKQERAPFIRVRSGDIRIYGDEFSANLQGPFIVQSKVAMNFTGRRIEAGFQGGYTASTGFDTCKGKFQLKRDGA